MAVLPPGTLLQLMYLKERLQRMKAGRFIEIGPGSGKVARRLLGLTWSRQAFDLDSVIVERLGIGLRMEIAEEDTKLSGPTSCRCRLPANGMSSSFLEGLGTFR